MDEILKLSLLAYLWIFNNILLWQIMKIERNTRKG